MSKTERTVILHYHIFKNSGTSFDHVLSHSFGDRHLLFDGPFPSFTIDQRQLHETIFQHPQTVAFSSHQIRLPQPAALQYRTIAAVFLRHPVLRVSSIYRFKRQKFDGTPISKAARELDFADWLDLCFRSAGLIGHVSNGQTQVLSAAYREKPLRQRVGERLIGDLPTAERNLRNAELIGRTEHFAEDVARFSRILAGHGLDLKLPGDLHRNKTQDSTLDPEAQVEKILSELPDAGRERLLQGNEQDMALYRFANRLIERGEA